MKKAQLLSLPLMILLAACGSNRPLQTTASLDPERYAGRWYEIASMPQRFQKGCACTIAEYTAMPDGSLAVRNACRKNGRTRQISGIARPLDPSEPGRLQVRFNALAKGKYYVIERGADYEYAVVGHPNRRSLWILSRQPAMPDTLYQGILSRVQQLGFRYDRIKPTDQRCDPTAL